MNQSQKGKKGFQKVDENLKLTERYSYKMTKAESRSLTNYCKEKGLTKANVIRTALKDFYKANGIVINNNKENNPNQLRIDQCE